MDKGQDAPSRAAVRPSVSEQELSSQCSSDSHVDATQGFGSPSNERVFASPGGEWIAHYSKISHLFWFTNAQLGDEGPPSSDEKDPMNGLKISPRAHQTNQKPVLNKSARKDAL